MTAARAAYAAYGQSPASLCARNEQKIRLQLLCASSDKSSEEVRASSLRTKLFQMKHDLNCEFSEYEQVLVVRTKCASHVERKVRSTNGNNSNLVTAKYALAIFVLVVGLVCHKQINIVASRCFLGNNYFVMEMSRPMTDCRICEDVHDFLVLDNPDRQEFAKYAYAARPILVRGATANWTAMQMFNFDFFKEVYTHIRGAHQAVEEECQFFPFRTEFLKLRDVFAMPRQRVNLSSSKPDEESWYIGW